jgi:DnaK suppressor protein
MELDTNRFKDLLEKELTTLEEEIKNLGVDDDKDAADEGDVADDIEELESSNTIGNQLKSRLSEVKDALQKIEDGKYGLCEVCGEQIEEDRLDANPSAKTCKAHMNQ